MLLLVFQGKYIVIGYWHSLLKFMESWSEVEVKHCMWRVVYWNYDWCSLMISVVHNHAFKVAACSYTIGPIQMVLYRKIYFECPTIALMIYDDIYIYIYMKRGVTLYAYKYNNYFWGRYTAIFFQLSGIHIYLVENHTYNLANSEYCYY